jgi:hypothetical protein
MDRGRAAHPREGIQSLNLQGIWTIFSESLSDSSIQILSLLQDNFEREREREMYVQEGPRNEGTI